MDINIQWVSPTGTAAVDYFNVLYKEFDLYPPINGLNDWILATDPSLPPTQLNYTITGLKENTVYRIMVTKACTGLDEIVDEITFIRTGYPIIATWQGPVVNNYPTLFYSVYYPDGPHIKNAEVRLYDTETFDNMLFDCGGGTPTELVLGRNGYLTGNFCVPANAYYSLCSTQYPSFMLPSNTSSGVSYYGRNSSTPIYPLCDGTASMPILLKYNTDYKLYSKAVQRFPSIFASTDPNSLEYAANWPAFNFISDPTQPYPNLNTANVSNISDAICFDPLTAVVDYTYADGTGRTDIANYLFSFVTSDGVNGLPLLDNAGNLVTSHNGSYNIYAPIKIETYAPGGGNPLGYTITGATYDGVSSTTYTYAGGTNAFTVGQEVFVSNVNPISFNFPFTSKTITAATPNSFTVAFSPAGTYQTGGTASGYIELTNNMTITVDLQPTQNVITLTNQNYLGLTLIQALNQIAGAINAAGTYTASAVVVAGLPYLKINMPDTSFGSASVIFQGPNILTKGSPDILQTSSAAPAYSSINYNGFLYAAFTESSSSKIVASDINNPTVTTDYGHPIDLPLTEILLVPEAPPATVYSLDYVDTGGKYSLNIAIDKITGDTYIADNTIVSKYNGTTLIASQDLSLLPGGPLTPIRLLEYNSTDNYLYVFVDGSLNNFYIVDNTFSGVIASGTYNQTNYIQRSTITAWNNTTAIGTVTGSPTQPILCATIPCPPGTIPNNANDGINSALFQDSTKTWNVVPPAAPSFAESSYYVYNSSTNKLGAMLLYNGTTYYPQPGISGDTIRVGTAITTSGTKTPFLVSNGDSYGIFHRSYISDYTSGNFNSRTWSNLSRYLIEDGRNVGSNGFLNTSSSIFHTNTTFNIDSYTRSLSPRDNKTNSVIGLDSTSDYLLYDITDGGTAYESIGNYVYVSLGDGTVDVIDNTGLVINTPLYKDYPANTIPVDGPLQLVADSVSGFVYGIARDARSTVDDMNVYILQGYVQYGVIDGASYWNIPVCGQIAVDESTGIIYFTGKNTRKFITVQFPASTGPLWNSQDIPSVYEKLDGFTYGDGSVIERIQGASFIGNGKFVVMNYLQQTYSTELKYTYEVSNLFVYDFVNNAVEQVLIGTGVNTYSGAPTSYNPNYYGESFGINNYNNDYCYGGLSIKTNPSNGQIFWKKSIVDEVYFSEAYSETGIAQIWGTYNLVTPSYSYQKLMRIWNVQSDGSLVPSKRTILDNYSAFSNLLYDSYYEAVIAGIGGSAYQFYLINPKTLGGLHGVNTIGAVAKGGIGSFISGLTPSLFPAGKQSSVYGVTINPTTITYDVRPNGAAVNGVFPHHYAVGDVVNITGITSTPANTLNFNNVTITAVTQTSFTITNTTDPSATFVTGGTVLLSNYANISPNLSKISSNNAGNIYCWGQVASGPNYPAFSNVVMKFEESDLYTQRESPQYIDIATVSTPCSATPDKIYVYQPFTLAMNNCFAHIPSMNTFWMIGRKNPICGANTITNAVYNAGTQTIRYYVANSFLVGKVVNITGVLPTTYNLNNVTITAVDPTWVEISYTGVAPAPFDPLTPGTSKVELSPNYVIKVVDAITIATIATIDLGFINDFVETSLINGNGRFQYSASEEIMYLYSSDPGQPIFGFSTITNTLVKSNSLNRMALPYTDLTTVYTLQDVNGVVYFNAYTSADTPTKRWFRLDAGNRSYLNAVHNLLTATVTDAVTSFGFNYDFYASYLSSSTTFGQWKEIMDTTWATIPSSITTTLNSTLEFVSFKMDSPILSIENNTTGYIYPVSNALNYVPVYSILIDNVNISNADALNITFANPDNPSCPFIRQVTIYF